MAGPSKGVGGGPVAGRGPSVPLTGAPRGAGPPSRGCKAAAPAGPGPLPRGLAALRLPHCKGAAHAKKCSRLPLPEHRLRGDRGTALPRRGTRRPVPPAPARACFVRPFRAALAGWPWPPSSGAPSPRSASAAGLLCQERAGSQIARDDEAVASVGARRARGGALPPWKMGLGPAACQGAGLPLRELSQQRAAKSLRPAEQAERFAAT